jgi:hypothetical protein
MFGENQIKQYISIMPYYECNKHPKKANIYILYLNRYLNTFLSEMLIYTNFKLRNMIFEF